MQSRDYIFWEVDVQADFMLPGGKLYVPGAEKLLPNIRKLTDAARRGEVFLVSHGCFHPANDPEFKQFPPHCLKGTAGAEFVIQPAEPALHEALTPLAHSRLSPVQPGRDLGVALALRRPQHHPGACHQSMRQTAGGGKTTQLRCFLRTQFQHRLRASG